MIVRRRFRGAVVRGLAALLTLALLGACDIEPRPTRGATLEIGGDADRGRQLLYDYGCTSCHVVPGVRALHGRTGPSLAGWSERRLVGGRVPNRPDRLVAWIMNPQAIDPGTGMPNLGVNEEDARDIASYLYTLR